MDYNEQAEVFHYLKTKGYSLQESFPKRLRFENDDDSKITIINSPTSLPVQIKIDGEIINYLAKDFKSLMKYLRETIK